MGSRSDQTLKEIDEIRESLGSKIVELERRMPDIARNGKKLIGVLIGGGMGSSALLFALRRLRKTGKKAAVAKAVTPSVTVNVLPKGTGPLALAVALVWAGVRFAEMKMRAAPEPTSKPAEVRPLPRERRA